MEHDSQGVEQRAKIRAAAGTRSSMRRQCLSGIRQPVVVSNLIGEI